MTIGLHEFGPIASTPSSPRSGSRSGSESDSVVGSSKFDTSTGNDTSHNPSSSSGETLARTETKAVNRSKLLVYLALLFAAAGVGTATYIFARREETDHFHGEVRPSSDLTDFCKSSSERIRSIDHLSIFWDFLVQNVYSSNM